MPLVTNPVLTALDVQSALITYLNADAYIQSIIVKPDGHTFNPVLDDDPTSVSNATGIQLVVTLAAEGEEDATMGGLRGGSAEVRNCFAVMLYQWESDNRDPAVKRNVIRNTGIVRQALMRYRQGPTAVIGSSGPLLWYSAQFRHQGPDVTTYWTPRNCRLSITMVDLFSRFPFA